MILKFHNVEWELINNTFSERYVPFLKRQLWESDEYYEDTTSLIDLESDIMSVCSQLGIEYCNINQLHEITVEGRENDPLYSKLNDLIHYYERVEQMYPPRWGFRNGNSELKLHDSDYDYFTVNRKYGYLYVMYPHVARHFAEAVIADDPTGTIQPQTLARPNFFCWLGEDLIIENEFKHIAKEFIEKYKLPYNLSDKKLALGYIPFAKLKENIPNLTDILKRT